ncbi:MAG: hypothetical protein C0601_02495 [Candidatus Muiribacterium halophilum]|uniref:LysM domain-containing protein n=1 Tax=Muiribacterium halophilum TaxID=2053465 RepID=A0A2N5ZKI1_MUIH1|nr:MAG: hypothetical protein C0601_02495 [Candidatus Muirbacterium halophilum]
MKKSIFIFISIFLIISNVYSESTLMNNQYLGEETDRLLKLIEKDKDVFPEKYKKIIDLKFKMHINYTDGKKEKADEFFEEMKALIELYQKFVVLRPDYIKAKELVKLMNDRYKEAKMYKMMDYYGKYFNRFEKDLIYITTLYDNEVEAFKDFDYKKVTLKDRNEVIRMISNKYLSSIGPRIDNSAYITKTRDMLDEVQEKIDFMREKYYNAIEPRLFNRMVARNKVLNKYYSELVINLQQDIDYRKKDYFYQAIKKESTYILDNLTNITDSTMGEMIDRIELLKKAIEKILSPEYSNLVYRFFGPKLEETRVLYKDTLSKRPYSVKDIMILEDELTSYKQIIDNYVKKTNDLNNIRKAVKEKYEEIKIQRQRFEEMSYKIDLDSSQYMIRADNAYEQGQYNIAIHSYKKSDDFLERQIVINELRGFKDKVNEYGNRYDLAEAFPEKYSRVEDGMSDALLLSQKGKFDKAYDLIRKIKNEVKLLIEERKQQLKMLELKNRMKENENFIVYTVKKGDTLSKIAVKYYKDANYAYKIWSWNYDNYPNPDNIYPGDLLKLYNVEKE